MQINLVTTPDQIQMITAPERFLGLFAGRRWGKTATVRNRIIYRLMNRPGFYYWYITPRYSQCFEEYELFRNHPKLRRFIRRGKGQPYPQIWFNNKSRIGFRSFEKPVGLRGGGLDEVWVDEIQDINQKQFWPIIRALISDKRGTLGVSGQFRGHNWYYKQFYKRGINPKNKLYRAWRRPSSTGIMFQSPAGIEELEIVKSQVPPAVYDQEYDCIPSANVAAVFPPKQIDAIVGGKPSGPRASKTYIMGLDLGRVVDHTALVVLEVETGAVVHAEKFPLGMTHATYAKLAGDIAKRYAAVVIMDTTGGATGGHAKSDEYVKLYRQQIKDVRTFWWSAQTKEAIIAHTALEIQAAKIKIPEEFDDLIDEVRSYEWDYRNGRYDYHAADGKHDDYVAALAQALWARRSGWAPQKGGVNLSSVLN